MTSGDHGSGGREWQIAVDTGGTFTDCVAVDPGGGEHRAKVLSRSALRGVIEAVIDDMTVKVREDWGAPDGFVRGFGFRLLGRDERWEVAEFDAGRRLLRVSRRLTGDVAGGVSFEVVSPEEAPVLAARLVTHTPPGKGLPPMTMRLATTRGTNALLEEKGAAVAFFVTSGFGDLLRIGTQQRPDLFAVRVERPEPLYRRVIEVPGRLDAYGNEIQVLDLQSVSDATEEALGAGCTSAAIALMHSYREPRHEEALAAHLAARGFSQVSVSSRLAPSIKLLPRAETAVVDAYLSAILRSYLDRVEDAVPRGRVYVMSSSGGLAPSKTFCAKDSLLSGPAGGVIGAAGAARAAGFGNIIAFDMGGTSTDVSRWEGDYDYQFEQTVGRARLVAPALKIETVAAGGGSVCGYERKTLFVGPESAGAQPGPACYGAGGPLTLTDVNLLLGRMDPKEFGLPLDIEASRRAANEIAGRAGLPLDKALAGFLRIANERMAAAIARISIRAGYDPAEAALVAFGGAGGQHACAIAELLGMRRIICPADMGLLSAAGLGSAVVERFAGEQVLAPLESVEPDVEARLARLGDAAVEALRQWGFADGCVRRRIVQCRIEGQESPLDIESETGDITQAFRTRYEEIYGYYPSGKRIEVVALRVIASTPAPERPRERFDEKGEKIRCVPHRGALKPGQEIDGPVVVQDRFSTIAIDRGWTGVVGSRGTLLLTRTALAAREPAEVHERAVELELFTHRFESIVEEMGVLLQRTAISTNMKERQDFSCAMLDAGGELIVNAPHIPVHLGALGLCVRTVAERMPLDRGDMIVTNHPAAGGSHLPDVTVISPAVGSDGALIGYVANRGHHAEIGGISPGSMPPAATRLIEEGVVLPPVYLFRRGEADYEAVQRRLLGAPWPTRAIEDNLADLKAQAAANLLGVRVIEALASKHGAQRVRFFMSEIKRRAGDAMRELLRNFPAGTYAAEERLDDGTRIALKLNVKPGRVHVDFSGTAPVHPGNLNTTPAIVRSVLVYVLRLWLQQPLPLNEGLLEPVSIELPRCFLNPEFPEDPSQAPAVVGGNVETSQRLVDTFLKALRLLACGQGTMNNFIFGNERCSYYETIGGGCGAGPGFDGASGVHSHMTNTAITDPEIIELRYPVRLDRFAIRRGSGGAGAHRGGDGLVRQLTFLERVSVSLLTQHRVERPFGVDGGQSGAPGRQQMSRQNGATEELGAVAQDDAVTGDRLIIETPGGGGWGGEKKG